MNIDKAIVNRALEKAGEEGITETEWTEAKSNRVRLIKDLYLASILEALSNTDWTSQKTRKKLQEVIAEEGEEDLNLTSYLHMYELPIDCAKPVALSNDGIYLVEGEFLYTDVADAILIYIKNYFTGQYKYEEAAPTLTEIRSGKYYKQDDEGNYIRVTDFEYEEADPQPASEEELAEDTYYVIDEDGVYQVAEEYDEEETYYLVLPIQYYSRVEEDYPFYDQPVFDPLLSEYLETIMAAKITMKLTGDMNKYQLLYNEARLMENRAIKASVAHGHNKDKGNPWWSEQLGLPNYGGN